MTSNNLGHALLLHTAYTQHKRVPVFLKGQESFCLQPRYFLMLWKSHLPWSFLIDLSLKINLVIHSCSFYNCRKLSCFVLFFISVLDVMDFTIITRRDAMRRVEFMTEVMQVPWADSVCLLNNTVKPRHFPVSPCLEIFKNDFSRLCPSITFNNDFIGIPIIFFGPEETC